MKKKLQFLLSCSAEGDTLASHSSHTVLPLYQMQCQYTGTQRSKECGVDSTDKADCVTMTCVTMT